LAGGNERYLKPLVQIDGVSLLLRTLQNLEICCDRVVIVLGYQASNVRESILSQYSGPLHLDFAVNDDYRLANGVSVLAASDLIDSEFILTMADHIMDRKLLELARDHYLAPESCALLVDYKLASIYDMGDATKTLVQAGKIVEIGKELDCYNSVDTGLFVCSPVLFDCLRKVYRTNGDVSLSEGIQFLAAHGRMHAIDILDAFWQDVDTPDMLEHAEKMLCIEDPCALFKN
jgi:choline kinase